MAKRRDKSNALIDKAVERENLFGHAYVAHKFNGRQAAISIGVPPAGANTYASKVLTKPNVQAIVNSYVERAVAHHGITVDELLTEYKKVAFASMAHYTRIDGNGGLALDLTDVTQDQLAAIGEVTVDEYTEGRGEDAKNVKRTKFKLHSKLDALGALLRFLTAGKGPQDPGTAGTTINTFNFTQNNVKLTPQQAIGEFQKLING